MDKKVAVLTGGTSGIGMQTALALKDAGYTVYELSRRAQGVEGLNHLVADVTDEAAVKNAVDEIVEREGRIDVLVNNAGFGISGAVEFTKTEDAKRLFDTNFFGMVNMNRAVIPVMREAGRGRIVNAPSRVRYRFRSRPIIPPRRLRQIHTPWLSQTSFAPTGSPSARFSRAT